MSRLSPGAEPESDIRITRKLDDTCQSLTLPSEQGSVLEFLTNAENAQRINGLVDDIYEALMAYQVCMSNYLSCTMSDVCVRLHCNKISTETVVNSL